MHISKIKPDHQAVPVTVGFLEHVSGTQLKDYQKALWTDIAFFKSLEKGTVPPWAKGPALYHVVPTNRGLPQPPTWERIATALRRTLEGLTEDNWCQGAMAVDEDGSSVSVWNSSARRWCVLGYLMKQDRGLVSADSRLGRLLGEVTGRQTGGRHWRIEHLNDDLGSTLADVKVVLAAALREVERETLIG